MNSSQFISTAISGEVMLLASYTLQLESCGTLQWADFPGDTWMSWESCIQRAGEGLALLFAWKKMLPVFCFSYLHMPLSFQFAEQIQHLKTLFQSLRTQPTIIKVYLIALQNPLM